MLNTIIIDKNENTKQLLSSYLKNIEEVREISCFDDFSQLNKPENDLTTVDLIIFDINSNCDSFVIDEIRKIKNKFPNVNFIATSYEINSELVSKILKEDVREFLLKPVIPNIFEAAIKKIKDIKNNVQVQKANTICVFSNKGGVGKTSLAVNLAYEMALQSKNKVCLLDLSFNSGDISTFLDIEPSCSVEQVFSNLENENEKTMFSLMNNYRNSSLFVFSFKDEFNIASKFDENRVLKLIGCLKNIFQYIIIDAPSNIDETAVSVLNSSDLVLLLGMMNLASIRNCQKCYELFNNLGYNKNKIKLIINRFIENSEITLQDAQRTIGAEVFFKIPNNYLTLIDAINLGFAVSETNPQSNIAKAYKNLARELLAIDFLHFEGEKDKVTYNHGIYNLLRRMGE